MDADFWHQRWKRGEIGFHEGRANAALVAHLDRLDLPRGSRIFVPLCGKTLDIAWLLAQGYRVAGVELSSIAIGELFTALELAPEVRPTGALTHYGAKNIDIWVGDIFDASGEILGAVDAVYDRAALVALPEAMRGRYAAHLTAITHTAPQLLITYEYDQRLYDGPPFSVREDALKRLYAENYRLEPVKKEWIAGGFKGQVDASIATWLLRTAQP